MKYLISVWYVWEHLKKFMDSWVTRNGREWVLFYSKESHSLDTHILHQSVWLEFQLFYFWSIFLLMSSNMLAQGLESPSPTWDTWTVSLTRGFGLTSPGYCGHLMCEPKDGRSPLPCLCHSAFSTTTTKENRCLFWWGLMDSFFIIYIFYLLVQFWNTFAAFCFAMNFLKCLCFPNLLFLRLAEL